MPCLVPGSFHFMEQKLWRNLALCTKPRRILDFWGGRAHLTSQRPNIFWNLIPFFSLRVIPWLLPHPFSHILCWYPNAQIANTRTGQGITSTGTSSGTGCPILDISLVLTRLTWQAARTYRPRPPILLQSMTAFCTLLCELRQKILIVSRLLSSLVVLSFPTPMTI